MEINEKLLSFIRRRLEHVVFETHDSIVNGTKLKSDIKFKAELLGVKQYIHIGHPKDNLVLKVTIIEADETSKHLLRLLEERLKNDPEKELYSFTLGLQYAMYEELFQPLELAWLKIDSIVLDFDDKSPITEGRQSRSFVRNAVKYITNLLKNGKSGRFDGYYDTLSSDIEDVLIEVHLTKTKDEGFKVDAEYSPDDDSISIYIDYNPKTLEKNLYDIIGVLNEYIEHELTHAKQNFKEDLPKRQPKNPFKYYSQPHEIEAQRKGFQRLSKLRKLPLDIVVKTWYDTHKDIHGLNDKQSDKIINQILNTGNEL